MKTSLRLAVLLVAVFGFTTESHAAPITYSFSGIASGQLGSSSFTNALVVYTATADTNNVIPWVLGDLDGDGIPETAYIAALGLTTVNIGGLGMFTLLDPMAIYATPPIPPALIEPGEEIFIKPVVWFGTLDSPPALDSATGLGAVGADALLGYNLATSFGPITSLGGVGYPPGLFVNTTGGNLSFASNIGGVSSTATFTASVPEPTSLSLLGPGILSLLGLARFRKRG